MLVLALRLTGKGDWQVSHVNTISTYIFTANIFLPFSTLQLFIYHHQASRYLEKHDLLLHLTKDIIVLIMINPFLPSLTSLGIGLQICDNELPITLGGIILT